MQRFDGGIRAARFDRQHRGLGDPGPPRQLGGRHPAQAAQAVHIAADDLIRDDMGSIVADGGGRVGAASAAIGGCASM
ncbi:hypothetical protein NS14008_38395 [Nocardia seriolae]|nr:hypothetical protein [Nocardia seriolae]OJF77878.1 hypothetical protein NS14008_38395 [Nocardia seriolae]